MYTLRLFKERDEINRTQICLGSSYQVKGSVEADVKFRIFGDQDSRTPEDGFAIYNDSYAYIMTDSGKTFETLNKPKLTMVD